jgi:hypothetical protein
VAINRSKNSHAFENMMEHVFLGELLRHMWFDRHEIVEVAKAQVDSWGYDVVLTTDSTTRYVQLKTSVPADVHMRLAHRDGGCVVAALPGSGADALEYRFWDASSGMTGLDKAKSTTYKKGQTQRNERPTHRVVPASHFTGKLGVSELCQHLFP